MQVGNKFNLEEYYIIVRNMQSGGKTKIYVKMNLEMI